MSDVAAKSKALQLQHCDADISVEHRTVTFKQKRSRFALVPDEVTVPLWLLKMLAGQLIKLEGAGEQGGVMGSCGKFDATTRKVATAVTVPGQREPMALSLGSVAPFKVLAGDVLEVEGREEEAGRFVPAMAVPAVVAADDAALGGPH